MTVNYAYCDWCGTENPTPAYSFIRRLTGKLVGVCPDHLEDIGWRSDSNGTRLELASMYACTVSTIRTIGRAKPDGTYWTTTTISPTFILDGNIQGIVNAAGAERIARRMFTDAGATVSSCTVSVYHA